MDGSYTAINKLTQQSIYAIEHLNLGKPHRRHLGIARLVIAPPRTQTGTLGHFISEKSAPNHPGKGLEGLDQSVTFVKILIRMNVRIYSYQQNYTNEYPNIFI